MSLSIPRDPRPQLGCWAPGSYHCRCLACGALFAGDKRALECANCAYSPEGEERRRNAQARLDAGACVLCGSQEHQFRVCPDLTGEARKLFSPTAAYAEVPLSDAARASIRDKCVRSLRELEAEAASSSPSPTTLRALASTVARSCPLEYRALAGPVVRLSEGLAGLVGCQQDLASSWVFPYRALPDLGDALAAACVALRVQLQASETAEVAR